MSKSGTAEARTRTVLGRKLFSARAKLSRRFYARFRRCRRFVFHGKSYEYCQIPFNSSWRNERAVEVPIFREVISQYQPAQILEVGNVMHWYMPTSHVVVDKYEQTPGLLNVDVLDYQPGRTFDLIIAISTLEHVGWDEEPKDPPKVRTAIDHLRRLLSPTGKLMVSLPLGYNTEVDALLAHGDVPWSSLTYLKRARWDNVWQEVPWASVARSQYDYYTPTSTAIAIGIVGLAEQ